ncbi:hypothetical protein ACFWZY_01670 [Streptomyces sp. NPDC058992]|uniref:hypothetical protein n=1 Tax=Streptomyces sp. NPDC058992 TaxID=3346688 RepID=UPI0036797735
MKVRADVAELLHAGLANEEIARRTGVSTRVVADARRVLGLPNRQSHASLEQALLGRSRAVEGGHREWTGPTYRNMQHFKFGGRRYLAARAAFIVRWGREPVGVVAPGCGVAACVAPEHVEDRPMRHRNRATYEAIFGGSS